jgi:hypothetical protein
MPALFMTSRVPPGTPELRKLKPHRCRAAPPERPLLFPEMRQIRLISPASTCRQSHIQAVQRANREPCRANTSKL